MRQRQLLEPETVGFLIGLLLGGSVGGVAGFITVTKLFEILV